jgi:hypothetical protein
VRTRRRLKIKTKTDHTPQVGAHDEAANYPAAFILPNILLEFKLFI